jgi:hypothetical protein
MGTLCRVCLATLVVLMGLAGSVRGEEAICIRPQKVPLLREPTGEGDLLKVTASVRPNGGRCGRWLFQVAFQMPDVVSFSAATGIPVGGHTSVRYPINALDSGAPEGVKRAFGGYVGASVTRIVARLEDGSELQVTPVSPDEQLRRRYRWLRGMRYFAHYYEAPSGVEVVELYSADGELLFEESGQDGAF